MGAQHVPGRNCLKRSQAKEKEKNNRASRFSVSQILLLPGRSPVLLSYFNPCEENENLKPETLWFLLALLSSLNLSPVAQISTPHNSENILDNLVSFMKSLWGPDTGNKHGSPQLEMPTLPCWKKASSGRLHPFTSMPSLDTSSVCHLLSCSWSWSPLLLFCPQLSVLSDTHPGARHSQWHHGMRCCGHSHHPLLTPWITLAPVVSLSSWIARFQQAVVWQWVPLTQSHRHITFYLIEPAGRICHLYFHLTSSHLSSL